MAFGIDGSSQSPLERLNQLRNRDPDAPSIPGGGGIPTPTTPAPTTPPVVRKPAPDWKTKLWAQYKAAGRPGDWQQYWRTHQPGAPAPAAPTDPGSAPRPMPPLNPAVPPQTPATPSQMIPSLDLPIPDYGMPFSPWQGGAMTPFAGIGTVNMPGDYNDPYNAYLSAIPVMETMRDKQISDAMATAGFSGNRYSTSAMNTAGQIGADTSERLNQMLNQTMYNQAQSDLDRAMQASGLGMQLGSLQDQMVQNRLQPLYQYGTWEQGRQDNFANQAYQDFLNSRLGFLPYLLQAAGGVGNPSPGTPVQTVTNPGTQPKIPPELIGLLGQLFG